MRFSLLLCFLVSCGGPARIQIESNPEGALVTLNGVEKGRTPMVVQEKFRGTADLLLELEGYEPYRSALDLRPKWFEVPLLIWSFRPKTDHFKLKWKSKKQTTKR